MELWKFFNWVKIKRMSKQDKKERELVCKVVVVGDGAVGKTCIMAVYQKGQFPAKYVPTVFENYTSTISIGEKKISLGVSFYNNLKFLALGYSRTSKFFVLNFRKIMINFDLYHTQELIVLYFVFH